MTGDRLRVFLKLGSVTFSVTVGGKACGVLPLAAAGTATVEIVPATVVEMPYFASRNAPLPFVPLRASDGSPWRQPDIIAVRKENRL